MPSISVTGDSVGDTIQAICVPHVSGPVHSLANTCISIFIAMLSMCLADVLFLGDGGDKLLNSPNARCVFNERYSLTQCAALLAVQQSRLWLGGRPEYDAQALAEIRQVFAAVASRHELVG